MEAQAVGSTDEAVGDDSHRQAFTTRVTKDGVQVDYGDTVWSQTVRPCKVCPSPKGFIYAMAEGENYGHDVGSCYSTEFRAISARCIEIAEQMEGLRKEGCELALRAQRMPGH